jgi:hypothetical protein
MSGTLKLWTLSQTGVKYEQIGQILFGKNLQEAMELTLVGSKYLLLVVGGYDSNIHCYTCLRKEHTPEGTSIDKHLAYKFSLTGHMNSLKDFTFTNPKITFSNNL